MEQRNKPRPRRWRVPLAVLVAVGIVWLARIAVERADPPRPPVAVPPADMPVHWFGQHLVAQGAAHIGPWRMNESDWRYVDDATVAMTDRGVIGVAWVDQARKAVLLQVYEPDGSERFAAPVDVSRSPDTFSWLPRLAFGDDDGRQVHMLWQEIIFSGGSHGGDILYSRSLDGGRRFGAPRNLSDSPAGAGKGRQSADQWVNGSLDMLLGPEGEVWAAWTEYEGALRLARSKNGGRNFSTPLHIAGSDARPARAPALAATKDQLVVAWTFAEDAAADLHMAVSDDGGLSFSEDFAVASSAEHADAPALAVDRRGRWHLAFTTRDGGAGGVPGLRYGTSDDPRAGFQTAPVDSGLAWGAAYPALAIDSADRVVLLWQHFPEPEARPRGLGWAAQSRDGESLTAGQPLLKPEEGAFNGGLQGSLGRKLAVADDGRIAVVNSHFRPGRVSSVELLPGARPDADD